MNKKSSQQSIVIIGGGPAGLLSAIALAKKCGIKSTIIDRADLLSQQDTEFDGRVISVNLGSKQFLDSLGLWEGDSDLSKVATPIKDIYVSDEDSSSHIHYDHKMIGDQPMGYMIEIRFLRKALLDMTRSLSDFITIKDNSEIRDMKRDSFSWEITIGSKNNNKEETILANLIIAADGKFSNTREQAEIETMEKDYHQTALVFTVEHELSHENYAFEHFMSEGPLAFLPMNTDKSAVVWTMSHNSAREKLELPNDRICAELLESFGEALGKFKIITKIWSYPLSIIMAKSMAQNRMVLVGDCAHGIHPVAGQGLNLGIKDIKDLVDVISAQYPLGIDIGSDSVIRKYGQKRRMDVVSISGSSHSIIRLFSNNIKPIKALRDTGLRIVNSIPPLKKIFMRKAMGL